MKKLVLGLFLVLFAGLSVGAPLQNFEYGGVAADGFDFDVSGGESVSGEVGFDNRVNRDLPLKFVLDVSGEDVDVTGEGFNVSANFSSGGFDDGLTCEEVNLSESSERYSCFHESENEIQAQSSSTVDFRIDVHPRIRPDDYSMNLSVRSVIGEGTVVQENVSAGNSTVVEAGSSSVAVNASESASVEVKALDRVSASPPSQGSDFAGGVSVGVSNGSEEVEASGTVSITYSDDSLDERDVNVYFYDGSLPEGERWVGQGGTHYPSNNSVVAQVDHFSTYAAFAEPESDDDSVPSFAGPIEWSPPRGEEDVNNGTDPDVPGDVQQNDTQEDDEDSSGEDVNDTVPGQEESTGPGQGPNSGSPGGPTGLFTGQSSGVIGGLFVLVLAVVAYLQYSGRIKLEEVFSGLRG